MEPALDDAASRADPTPESMLKEKRKLRNLIRKYIGDIGTPCNGSAIPATKCILTKDGKIRIDFDDTGEVP